MLLVHVSESTENFLLLKSLRLFPGCNGRLKEQTKKVKPISEKGSQLWKPKVIKFHCQQTCCNRRLNVLNNRQFSRKFVEVSPYLIRLTALQHSVVMHTSLSFWCLLQLTDNLMSLFSLPLLILIEIQFHKTKSNPKTDVRFRRITRSYWYSRHQYRLQRTTQFPTFYNNLSITEKVENKKCWRKTAKAHC